MKGVVLEIRDGEAAVLLEDKTVRRIRCDCEVGDTVEIEEKGRITQFPKRATRWAAAAVAAVVLVSGGSYGYNNAYAYSYVTLDANPSIEYVLNRKNEVLSVSALNEDAVSIVEELNADNVRGMALTELLEETTELLYRDSYLDAENEDCLLISVTSRGDRQRENLNAEIDEFSERESSAVYVTNATIGEERSARSLGMSTGRYKLMEDTLAAEGGSAAEDPRSFGEAPVAELLERSGHGPAPAMGAESRPEPDTSGTEGQEPQSPDRNETRPEPQANGPVDAPAAETESGPAMDGIRTGGPESGAGGSAEMGVPSGDPAR